MFPTLLTDPPHGHTVGFWRVAARHRLVIRSQRLAINHSLACGTIVGKRTGAKGARRGQLAEAHWCHLCVGDDVLLLILSGRFCSIVVGDPPCLHTGRTVCFVSLRSNSQLIIASHLICPSVHCVPSSVHGYLDCVYILTKSVSLSTSTPTFCSRSRIEHTHNRKDINSEGEEMHCCIP